MVSGFGRPAPAAGEGAVDELPETTSAKSGFDELPETTSEKSGFLGSSAMFPPLTLGRKGAGSLVPPFPNRRTGVYRQLHDGAARPAPALRSALLLPGRRNER